MAISVISTAVAADRGVSAGPDRVTVAKRARYLAGCPGRAARIFLRQTSRISSASGESSGQARESTTAPIAWANRSMVSARTYCRCAALRASSALASVSSNVLMPLANSALMASGCRAASPQSAAMVQPRARLSRCLRET